MKHEFNPEQLVTFGKLREEYQAGKFSPSLIPPRAFRPLDAERAAVSLLGEFQVGREALKERVVTFIFLAVLGALLGYGTVRYMMKNEPD